MKRIVIGSLAALALIGCSKSGTVHLSLTSNDAAALRSGPTAMQSLVAETTADGGTTDDLSTVKSVTVTVSEIDAHVVDTSSKAPEVDDKTDEVDGSKVSDTDGKWETLSSTATTVDLMTLRNGLAQSLGLATLPDGKITQIRLKLKTDGATGTDGKDVITGAVVDATGQTCDLQVPHSATDPGVKIEGVFKAMTVKAGDSHQLEVNVKLKDSQKDPTQATCTYFLNPVIKVEKFEDEGPEQEGSGDDSGDHSDGGSETGAVDSGM